MELSHAVSRAVLLSRTVEAALHSRETWYIEIGHLRLPAERITGPDSVAFYVQVPEICFLTAPTTMTLYEGEFMWSVHPLTYPGGGGFPVVWEFEVDAGLVSA